MKAKQKNIIFAVVITAAVLAAAYFLKITPAKDFYGEQNPLYTGGAYVTFSVDCRSGAQNRGKFSEELQSEKYIPADGYIIPPEKISLKEGDSAYSVLERAIKYYKIPFDVQGKGENSLGTVYVRGINNIYEFSAGELSGWMYRVNGEYPSVGCDETILKNGDEVSFVYVVDMGEIFQ